MSLKFTFNCIKNKSFFYHKGVYMYTLHYLKRSGNYSRVIYFLCFKILLTIFVTGDWILISQLINFNYVPPNPNTAVACLTSAGGVRVDPLSLPVVVVKADFWDYTREQWFQFPCSRRNRVDVTKLDLFCT